VLIKAIADQIDQHECKSHRILIVDDEPRLTKILKRSIEKRTSHVVKVENNSRKALESAREFKPDLILLDMYMPAIGGEELVKEIIKDPKLSGTKVVFLTSLLTHADMGDSGQKIGEHLFLAKPVNPDVLVDTIREQMAA
jgi:CheY-like chemotaxis protein